jgi:hypothetical protein
MDFALHAKNASGQLIVSGIRPKKKFMLRLNVKSAWRITETTRRKSTLSHALGNYAVVMPPPFG